METQDLADLVGFSPDDVRRETVFETTRIWSQLLCLERNQTFGPVTDEHSDAIFTIVAGEAVFVADRRRRRLGQWGCVLVPAGSELSIWNASADPLVLLVVTAPPPATSDVEGQDV